MHEYRSSFCIFLCVCVFLNVLHFDYCFPFVRTLGACEVNSHQVNDGVSSNQAIFIVSDEIHLENHCNLNQFPFSCGWSLFVMVERVCGFLCCIVILQWICCFWPYLCAPIQPNPQASICYLLVHIFSRSSSLFFSLLIIICIRKLMFNIFILFHLWFGRIKRKMAWLEKWLDPQTIFSNQELDFFYYLAANQAAAV